MFVQRPRLPFLSLLLTLGACEPEDDPSRVVLSTGQPCLLGTEEDAASELFLLPSRQEAERLSLAEKHRQQGTINLLLARHDARGASTGTKCDVLEISGEFARVKTREKQLEGWLPVAQLRPDRK